jgi:hypothetical protein
MSSKKLRNKVGCLKNKARNFTGLFLVQLGKLSQYNYQDTDPSSYPLGTCDSFLGSKAARNSPPASFEVNEWIPPFPPKVFVVWCLISEETTVVLTEF